MLKRPFDLALCGMLAAGALTLGGHTPASAEDLLPRSEFFDEYDRNSDGKVTADEFDGSSEIFELLDKNKDGMISTTELGLPAEYKPSPKRRKAKAGGKSQGKAGNGKARKGKAGKGKAGKKGRAGQGSDRAAELRKRLLAMDTDKDGKVTRAEWQGQPALFERLDRNEDGVLDAKDRRQPGQQGKGGKAAPRRRAAKLSSAQIKSWDRDGDGKVSADEFPGRDRGFAHFDADKDGYLTEADIRAAAGKTKKKKKKTAAPTTPSGSTPPFASQDADGDGQLTRREFPGTNAEWRALDANGDGVLTREEAQAK